MRAIRAIALGVIGAAAWTASSTAMAQIVINEVVKEERTAGSGAVNPDVREFVELYNAGGSTVNIGDWSLVLYDYAAGSPVNGYGIPTGTMLAAGDYYVIGGTTVPNVDFVAGSGQDLFPDVAPYAIELRDGLDPFSSNLIDAVAYDTSLGGGFSTTPAQAAQAGRGFRGQLLSMNAIAPNVTSSYSRYLDGRDTNSNGRDFGMFPATPGTSNNLPQNPSHTVPDVDSLTPGTSLTEYHGSFFSARVINPTAPSAINPRSISASPQGGNAIVAWDQTGGGNTVYSKELVNSFDIYAYFDTAPLGVAVDTQDEEWETSAYGIGTADAFYANPNPTGLVQGMANPSQNGSSGIGWVYQQWEENPTLGSGNFSRLLLVDFGEGGDTAPGNLEWTIIQDLDISGMASDWYRLGIDYDPTTGDVTARFDDDEYMFNTATGLVGNFFIGYREGITAQGSRFDKLNPPIFDIFPGTTSLTGDYNGDGKVDAADYVVWRKNPGAFGGNQGYLDWRANFGAGGPGAGAGQGLAAVPEPGSLALVMLGLMLLGAAPRLRSE